MHIWRLLLEKFRGDLREKKNKNHKEKHNSVVLIINYFFNEEIKKITLKFSCQGISKFSFIFKISTHVCVDQGEIYYYGGICVSCIFIYKF